MSSKVKNRLKVLIIGAGRIGASFDNSESTEVLTHAHAVRLSNRADLVGFVDTDLKNAKMLGNRWGDIPAFKTIKDAWGKVGSVDIVIVATPDQTHYQILTQILKFKPKLVICEKPITTKLFDTKKIISEYKTAQIPLLINYSRRYDRYVQELKKKINNETYGRIIWASFKYTKGILHNGSHAIDLARFLFGEVRSVKSLSKIVDYSKQDPSYGAHLKLVKCPQLFLIPADQRNYSIFELEIGFAKRRIIFVDSGFKVQEENVNVDPRYFGFFELKPTQLKTTALNKALSVLLNNAIDHLLYKTELICDGSDAFKTQKICYQILNKKS